nr:MAG TPA: helix-turn-helix domain protein [Caudoviricetes sp.]
MNIWLMDEQPVVVDRGLARIIGFSEAVVITQLHQWIEYNRKHKKNYKDGYYWTYGSMEKMHEEYFDILGSVRTVRRVFKKLEKNGYLIVDNYNKLNFDKTSWYRVNYEKFNELKKEYRDGQNDHTDEDKMTTSQVDKMTISDVDNLTTPIPNNKNIIKNNNISYHSSSNNIIYSESEQVTDERLNDKENKNISSREKYNRQYFKDSFGYNRVSKDKQEEVDKWIDYAVDICLKIPSEEIRIGMLNITAGELRDRLLELRYEHINNVLSKLNPAIKVSNHKNYILFILYNAKEQYESSLSTSSKLGSKFNNKPAAPFPEYLEKRINNRGKTGERVITQEDENAYAEMMKVLGNGKEQEDVQ